MEFLLVPMWYFLSPLEGTHMKHKQCFLNQTISWNWQHVFLQPSCRVFILTGVWKSVLSWENIFKCLKCWFELVAYMKTWEMSISTVEMQLIRGRSRSLSVVMNCTGECVFIEERIMFISFRKGESSSWGLFTLEIVNLGVSKPPVKIILGYLASSLLKKEEEGKKKKLKPA